MQGLVPLLVLKKGEAALLAALSVLLMGVRVGALVRLSDHLASAGEPPCAGPGTARHPDPHTVPLF